MGYSKYKAVALLLYRKSKICSEKCHKPPSKRKCFGKASRFSIFQVCSQDFASATYPLRYPGSQSPTAILSISSSVNPCVRTKPQVGLVGVASMCSPFLDKIGIFHKKTMDGETVGDFKPNIFVNLDYNHRVVLVAKCWDLPNPHICPMTYLPSISPGMGRTILLSAKTPWINFRTAQSS